MLEQTQRGIKPLTANVAMSVQLYSILHPLPDWINNLSFVIFDIWALSRSVLSVRMSKNYKWWLNPVWHRMLYSCTHMVTVADKGLTLCSLSGICCVLMVSVMYLLCRSLCILWSRPVRRSSSVARVRWRKERSGSRTDDHSRPRMNRSTPTSRQTPPTMSRRPSTRCVKPAEVIFVFFFCGMHH